MKVKAAEPPGSSLFKLVEQTFLKNVTGANDKVMLVVSAGIEPTSKV